MKVLECLINLKTFLNKGTKHNKNYMEGLNSKNKNIKGGSVRWFPLMEKSQTYIFEDL